MSIFNCNGQSEVVSGTLFIRKVKLSRIGEQVGGHKHNFDHTTIFLKGRVGVHTITPELVERDYVFRAGDHFLIDKDVIHELTALDEDCEFWCVYSHRNGAGEVTETFQGIRATQ